MSESDAGADRAISLREAARILNVCVRTVRREIERRRLIGFRVGRSLRIRMSDLRRYMERELVPLWCKTCLEQRDGLTVNAGSLARILANIG